MTSDSYAWELRPSSDPVMHVRTYEDCNVPRQLYIYSSDLIPTGYSDTPIAVSSDMPSWSGLAADKKRRQQAAIPQGWLITPPPETTRNVIDIPETCGLLTPEELTITNEDVNVLLKKLANSEWSAVAVTTAFYKRAIVAQQLVTSLCV